MHRIDVAVPARGKVTLAAVVILLASLCSAGAMAAETRGARPTASVDAPGTIYQNYCSVCHGERGDGKSMARFALNPQPADFTSEKTRKKLSRAHMIEVLSKGTRTKQGKPTAMVAWTSQLSRKHIETVVDYVIIKFMDGKIAPNDQIQAEGHEHHGHDHSVANVKEVDYPYGLKASAARGTSIYAAHCAGCHGPKGDGTGNAALTVPKKPRNFHDPDFREFATGFSLFSAVSRGSGHMPAWGKTLSNQDIADVSEYVQRTYVKRHRTASAAK